MGLDPTVALPPQSGAPQVTEATAGVQASRAPSPEKRAFAASSAAIASLRTAATSGAFTERLGPLGASIQSWATKASTQAQPAASSLPTSPSHPSATPTSSRDSPFRRPFAGASKEVAPPAPTTSVRAPGVQRHTGKAASLGGIALASEAGAARPASGLLRSGRSSSQSCSGVPSCSLC